jgi:hypothetical protein
MHDNNGNANSIFLFSFFLISAIFKPQLFVFVVWSKITLFYFIFGLSTLNQNLKNGVSNTSLSS